MLIEMERDEGETAVLTRWGRGEREGRCTVKMHQDRIYSEVTACQCISAPCSYFEIVLLSIFGENCCLCISTSL